MVPRGKVSVTWAGIDGAGPVEWLDLDILPGPDHFLHLEDPSRVNGRIVEFLTAP
jgi:pimeloyl-ACP methyl ester carboxylesterase